MGESTQYLYAGISGVELETDSFDLGEGVTLKRTYAHLFSTYMMAFSPPGLKGYHPAPWKAAKGGFGFDIVIELRVPDKPSLSDSMDARETIWWIAALLRVACVPFLTVPVISDYPFSLASEDDNEPTLEPFEITPRMFSPPKEGLRKLSDDDLEWAKKKWQEAGKLLTSNPKFYSAFKAFDAATVQGKTSSSLLALWGGLEQLFSPSPSELRFRVSSMLACYLNEPGEERLDLYKRILKLYNARSTAAHTSEDTETGPLVETYVIMRNALIKMIDENKVPTQQYLESRLFGCE